MAYSPSLTGADSLTHSKVEILFRVRRIGCGPLEESLTLEHSIQRVADTPPGTVN